MSSLVEVQPLAAPLAESPMMETGEQRRETNVLQLVWRSRWLILVCMLFGGGSSWAILKRVTPLYTSRSRIYVERSLPQLINSQLQLSQGSSYLYTQAELIRSTGVLAAATESKQLAGLKT